MTDFDTPGGRQIVTRPHEEHWECQVRGRVFVEITNHRGAPQVVSAKGVGQIIRITAEDRERNQERIVDPQGDPFINGMLRRVDKNAGEDEATTSPNALSEADLESVFQMEQDDFEDYVKSLNEVAIRRLKEKAPIHASMMQGAFLDELIEERFKIGGTTPSYEEMQRAPM